MTQEGAPGGQWERPVRPAAAPTIPPPNEGFVNRFEMRITATLDVVPAASEPESDEDR